MENLRADLDRIHTALGPKKKVDIYEVARVDPTMTIEEIMKNLVELKEEGHFKVSLALTRYLGLSVLEVEVDIIALPHHHNTTPSQCPTVTIPNARIAIDNETSKTRRSTSASQRSTLQLSGKPTPSIRSQPPRSRSPCSTSNRKRSRSSRSPRNWGSLWLLIRESVLQAFARSVYSIALHANQDLILFFLRLIHYVPIISIHPSPRRTFTPST